MTYINSKTHTYTQSDTHNTHTHTHTHTHTSVSTKKESVCVLGRRVIDRDLGRQRQTWMHSRSELFSLTLPTAFSDGLVRVKSGC